jgi:hypothetical protein
MNERPKIRPCLCTGYARMRFAHIYVHYTHERLRIAHILPVHGIHDDTTTNLLCTQHRRSTVSSYLQSTSSYWQALPVHKYRATQTSSVLGWCFQTTDEHLPTSPRNTMPPLSRSRTKVLESSETSPTICQYKRFNNHVDLNRQGDHSENPKSRKLTFNSQHYDVL